MGVPAGLCDSCRWRRIIETRTGARFVFCERSRTDPAFPRYPPLPVRACRGYERVAQEPANRRAAGKDSTHNHDRSE